MLFFSFQVVIHLSVSSFAARALEATAMATRKGRRKKFFAGLPAEKFLSEFIYPLWGDSVGATNSALRKRAYRVMAHRNVVLSMNTPDTPERRGVIAVQATPGRFIKRRGLRPLQAIYAVNAFSSRM
ncbi:hypothetical protein AO411_2019810 [Salmonella enterica subsp. enterica serovar Sarajane]|nr:hypothetical protein AO411_2019810 [Salmonella enterica subsp. enterica serovar Sarajane]